MTITALINLLRAYREMHGDVILYSEKDDGRSSWVSKIVTSLRKDKHGRHLFSVTAGY